MIGPDPSYQVEALRRAAEHLGGESTWKLSLPIVVPDPWDGGVRTTNMELPGAVARPLRGVLLSAAEQIERAGSPLGLPVNNALEIAGLFLAEDLGHNR